MKVVGWSLAALLLVATAIVGANLRLFAFVALHPEGVEAVDAIVVRSVRSNPNNSYGTVYKKEGGYLAENARD
jgi:hypothetical protein